MLSARFPVLPCSTIYRYAESLYCILYSDFQFIKPDRLPLEENQPADVVFPDDSFDFFLVLLVFIAVYGNHNTARNWKIKSPNY